jgi:hypothetical protein
MTLLKRIMWPHKGETVEIYRDNQVFMRGYVLYSGHDVVSVLGKNGHASSINSQELLRGIENRSITVKKLQ